MDLPVHSGTQSSVASVIQGDEVVSTEMCYLMSSLGLIHNPSRPLQSQNAGAGAVNHHHSTSSTGIPVINTFQNGGATTAQRARGRGSTRCAPRQR